MPTKRKPLREQLAELQARYDKLESYVTERDLLCARANERIAKLEQLVLAYKRFALKVCLQRDLKHDAPPQSHALALKESLEAGAEVERLSRELWPEAYAELDEKTLAHQRAQEAERTEELERKEPGKWN